MQVNQNLNGQQTCPALDLQDVILDLFQQNLMARLEVLIFDAQELLETRAQPAEDLATPKKLADQLRLMSTHIHHLSNNVEVWQYLQQNK
ncbi:hypothetical protein [Microscilla marina]|uniref:Uncharacterized protein n=1 Tax=Microscilla marina ATCC 23134 TaxID=313606 RepID=A1ZDR2_MICM2|nr:hypothetical protein [Microscilla marina]EAY31220.1 hypothetical protein M23134_04053 [Microscilla marina ATCC 23134]